MCKVSSFSIMEWYNQVYWNQESSSDFRPYKTYNSFINYLEVPPGRTLFDVGVGDGRLLKVACERDIIDFGVDFSESAIVQATTFAPNAHLAVANGERLPFTYSSFDYLTCLGSLEHFFDIETGLDEMVRVCKNRGTLYHVA